MNTFDHSFLNSFCDDYQKDYSQKKVILSFGQYLDKVRQNPKIHLRNSPSYLLDMLDHFGSDTCKSILFQDYKSYKVFAIDNHNVHAVIGGQRAHSNIVHTLNSFKHRGQSFKLIVLHGPNGSSKSSTINTLVHGLDQYSKNELGALYKFSWIFPKDKKLQNQFNPDKSISIGFNPTDSETIKKLSIDSFSSMDESELSCKIDSEFKENPIYLIPMPYRKKFIEECFDLNNQKTTATDHKPDKITHVLNDQSFNYLYQDALSKKNKEIFERLLKAYDGNILRVFRHVQVERFFLSRQYRCGISTVDPQMSIDAYEKQLTIDRYIHNLPSILQTIDFYQYSGQLVEGNRGIVEFSDFLKRPIESFKYLLSTIEKGLINLPSSSALLDTVFFATTNDTHWDAFTQIPDFSSFRGRMHLVSIPYLLTIDQEKKIYSHDKKLLEKQTKLSPHCLYILCLWSVMTRLKPPKADDQAPSKYHSIINNLDPLNKAKLYNNQDLGSEFTKDQKSFLANFTTNLYEQYLGSNDYEGKTGASPRVVRDILYKAAKNSDNQELSPWNIIDEISKLNQQKSLYSFLQIPAKKNYHNHDKFIEYLSDEINQLFEQEFIDAMSMVESLEYEKLFTRYIDNVVALHVNQKIYDSSTCSYTPPSEKLMEAVEKIINPKSSKENFRQSLLSTMAAWKIDHPQQQKPLISEVFNDLLTKLKNHYYQQQRNQIDELCINMIKLSQKDKNHHDLSPKTTNQLHQTFKTLEKKYHYSENACIQSIKKLIKYYEKKH